MPPAMPVVAEDGHPAIQLPRNFILPLRHGLISLLVIAVLGMQASTFITGSKVWPFLAYCMYAKAKKPSTIHTTVKATLDDGREIDIDDQFIGLEYFAWRNLYLIPLRQNKEDVGIKLADRIEAKTGGTVQRIEVRIEKYDIIDGELYEDVELRLVPLEGSGS